MLSLVVSSLALSASPVSPSRFWSLNGRTLPRVSDGTPVDVGAALADGPGTKLLVLGTYPADFNMIEYAQCLAHYTPELKKVGVSDIYCVVNGKPSSCSRLAELVDLPDDVILLADEAGEAGRDFGVSRGWKADEDIPGGAYAKLFGMLVGLGASKTLPSVITGYLGNPSGSNAWIKSAIAQGTRAGRWPGELVVDLDAEGGTSRNAFDELPVVSGWGRRPLELATLRLQTMLGISLAEWDALQPTDERCLTQLGGLVAIRDGKILFEYRDGGICNVCNFETLIAALR